MKGKIGCPTKIVTLPRCVRELAKHRPVELSEQAKRRLEALDWYYKNQVIIPHRKSLILN